MGELNFNSYNAALLEGGDEEEATAMLDTQQQEQQDQEVLQCWRANWTTIKLHRQQHWGRKQLYTALSALEHAPEGWVLFVLL